MGSLSSAVAQGESAACFARDSLVSFPANYGGSKSGLKYYFLRGRRQA
jgi:hypothetical protein